MQTELVWTVLLSRNIESAMTFYGDAVGWTFEALPGRSYPTWTARAADGHVVASFVDASGSDFPDATELWLPYFTVTTLDERVREAERLGATILRSPFDIPGFGRVAILRQPGGGIIGWRSLPAS